MKSKKISILLIIPALLFLAVGAASSQNLDISGWWSARVLTDVIELEVEQEGNMLTGVAYLISPMGSKNVYHWAGVLQGRNIVGLHHSGHKFSGEVDEKGHIIGVVTTKKGMKIPIEAERMKKPPASNQKPDELDLTNRDRELIKKTSTTL